VPTGAHGLNSIYRHERSVCFWALFEYFPFYQPPT
jgi:hypothetical protein